MFVISESNIVVKKTKHKGFGVFAKNTISKGVVIGDYTGELVDYLNVDYAKEKKQMYLMYYNDTYGIYPDLSEPGVHLINHSCSPNCWLAKYKDRTLVFALRDIVPNEEITINYLLSPKNNCKNCPHTCKCDIPACTGSMHLSEEKYLVWQKFQKINWKEKGVNNKSKYLKPLKKYPKKVNEDYLANLIKAGFINYL